MIHHIDFGVSSVVRSRRFYTLALAPFGMRRDNGAPGLRSRYAVNYYSTCVLDPDGHNIEAVCRL
jgi:catechol 2,3-dioxygenase-like lactoylglutathione lyase family enzyme